MSTPFPPHRPGQLLAFTGLIYAIRLMAGVLLVLPLASAVRQTGVGQQVTGDAVLFAPGATHLFEMVRLATPALSAALPVSSALFVIAILLQVVPQGALVHGLAAPTESLTRAMQRSLASFPRFLLFGGLGFLAQIGASILGLVAARALRQAVGGVQRAESGDLAYAAVILLSALSVCALGALVDLARCAHTRGIHAGEHASVAVCTHQALQVLLRHPVRCAAAALAPLLCVAVLGVFVGFIVGALHIERGDNWRWGAILILHQAVIMGACVAEVRWLSRAWDLLCSASPL